MSTQARIAYIGLGSNLDDPRAQLEQALQELARLPGSSLRARSALYASMPLDHSDQPDYVNAVAQLQTRLPALLLLDHLQAIEQAHQRVRTRHWGPRTLDLDLLLYGDQRIDQPRLQVPHPQMHLRSFVLRPLQEIAPGLSLPGLPPLAELIDACDSLRLQRLPD